MTNIRIWEIVTQVIVLDKKRYYRKEITNELEMPIHDTTRRDKVLDTSRISLLRATKTPISPYTKIIIDITENENGTESVETIYRYVDNDTVSNVARGNQPIYRHTLDLIEPLKITERFILDNILFTNYLPENYGEAQRAVDFKLDNYSLKEIIYHEDSFTEAISEEITSTEVRMVPIERHGWFSFIIDLVTGVPVWDAIKNQFVYYYEDIVESVETVTRLVEHCTVTGFFPTRIREATYTSNSERFIGPYVIMNTDSQSSSGYSFTIDPRVRLDVKADYNDTITDHVAGIEKTLTVPIAFYHVKLPDGTEQSLLNANSFTYRQEGRYVFTQIYAYFVDNVGFIFDQNPAYYREANITAAYSWTVNAVIDRSGIPKKYNMAEVFDRTIATAIPLKNGVDEPRFVLDNNVREWLSMVEAPEYTFTGNNLKEALQIMGDYLNAKPKLIPSIKTNTLENVSLTINGTERWAVRLVDDDWSNWNVITFVSNEQTRNDNYTGSNYSLIDLEYPSDDYATDFVSDVENATATNYEGVITNTEPFTDGFISLRTDDGNFEISDNICIAKTKDKVRSVIDFKIKYGSSVYNVSAAVVEFAKYNTMKEYNTELGSETRWLHLYYKTGEKNIYGFNLANPVANTLFSSSIKQAIKHICSLDDGVKLKDIMYQITYVPFIDFRARQFKGYIDKTKEKSSIIYNQKESEVDTELFGKDMYYTLLRTGNPKQTRTQYFNSLRDVPKEGQWHASGYFCFLVNREIGCQGKIKASSMWSKNFNSLYSETAIKSHLRQFEISEVECGTRKINFSEFCIVDIVNEIDDFYSSSNYEQYQDYIETQLANVGFATDELLCALADKLSNRSGDFKKITCATVTTETLNTDKLSEDYGSLEYRDFITPVSSFPLGLSICLYFGTDDNYSAATYSQDVSTSLATEHYIPYSNDKGRADNIFIGFGDKVISTDDDLTFGKQLYQWKFNASLNKTYALFTDYNIKKDSREKLSVTAQLHFVSTNKHVLVYPELPATMPILGDFDTEYYEVVFEEKQSDLSEYCVGNIHIVGSPNAVFSSKTKQIMVTERPAIDNSSSGGSGGIVPFIVVTPQPQPHVLYGEGYGIITKKGKLCVYVEGKVYKDSVLPAIYLQFRRNI